MQGTINVETLSIDIDCDAITDGDYRRAAALHLAGAIEIRMHVTVRDAYGNRNLSSTGLTYRSMRETVPDCGAERRRTAGNNAYCPE